MDFRVMPRRYGPTVHLAPAGELDLETRAALDELYISADGPTIVACDMRHLTFSATPPPPTAPPERPGPDTTQRGRDRAGTEPAGLLLLPRAGAMRAKRPRPVGWRAAVDHRP